MRKEKKAKELALLKKLVAACDCIKPRERYKSTCTIEAVAVTQIDEFLDVLHECEAYVLKRSLID